MAPQGILLIPAIPATYVRFRQLRSDLSYLPFSLATWRQWCVAHDQQLIVADQVVAGDLASAPPTVQRWQIARDLLAARPEGTRLTMVDADTMVRWDAPDFSLLSPGDLSVVPGGTPDWIWRSVAAYQTFVPAARIDWWTYFNAGVVVMNRRHLGLLDAFVDLYRKHRPELENIQRAGDFGTDQTLMNLLVRALEIGVHHLLPIYNLLHCFRLKSRDYVRYEHEGGPLDPAFEQKVLGAPGAFDFVDHACVWHFTHTVRTRPAAMAATWNRIRHHYGGQPDPRPTTPST
jgi:hypothetical protein